MKCIFCKSDCNKNGFDRNHAQRYICTKSKCHRTFTAFTKPYREKLEKIRVVLHLLLAGCQIDEISEKLDTKERFIKSWKKKYLKNLTIIPENRLLSIEHLFRIYNGIEKSRISQLHYTWWKNRNNRK